MAALQYWSALSAAAAPVLLWLLTAYACAASVALPPLCSIFLLPPAQLPDRGVQHVEERRRDGRRIRIHAQLPAVLSVASSTDTAAELRARPGRAKEVHMCSAAVAIFQRRPCHGQSSRVQPLPVSLADSAHMCVLCLCACLPTFSLRIPCSLLSASCCPCSVLAPCSHHPAGGQSFSGRPKCQAVNDTPRCQNTCENQQDYHEDKSFGASAYGQYSAAESGGAQA